MSQSNWEKKWLFHEPEPRRSLSRTAWWAILAALGGLVFLAHAGVNSLL